MTVAPELKKENVDYAFSMMRRVENETGNRRAGSDGEKRVQKIWLGELMRFCDETSEEKFRVRTGAGTLTQKTLSAVLVVCNILFAVASATGVAALAVVSLLISLLSFAIFAYKFLFDGDKLDFLVKQKYSENVFGKRYSRGETKARVVLVTRADSPQKLRFTLFGGELLFLVTAASVVGNTFLFCSQALFLFSGAPKASAVFSVLCVVCWLFVPIYFFAFLLTERKTASGVSGSLVPTSTALGILKQFFENGIRYDNTEICCLVTGGEYSSHAGAYSFANRHRRRFNDVPTVFIPIDELTGNGDLCVFFRDASGVSGNTEIASVIADAADNLKINIKKERTRLGSASYTPFSAQGLCACSLGSSKKKTGFAYGDGDKVTSVKDKTVSRVGALLIETVNYFDSI